MLEACDVIGSPLGDMVATSADGLLTGISWRWDREVELVGSSAVLDDVADQLAAYWAGELYEFDVPLDWSRVAPFARSVLHATVEVPFGRTATYGRIAETIGRPGEARAVGGALRENPWAVIVPCHRIVAADGALTGYAGGPTTGGHLDVKQALLDHEGQRYEPRLF
jgi:methylated-DNA-[protein]-cysteine S-methyltransferase